MLPVLRVACALLACGVPTAAAAERVPSGVHVDPGSPVAKEYAIPLGQARSGGNPAKGEGSLFGSGLRRQAVPAPVSPAAPSATAPRPRRPPARHRRAVARPVGRPTGPAPARVPSGSASASASALPSLPATAGAGSAGGLAWMAGIAAGVLVLGGLGGGLVGRWSRGDA